MIADDQNAVLESPLAAGEELSRTAAFRCDCALVRSRSTPEVHVAADGAHLAEPPAAAEFNWRWRRRRERGCGGRFRLGLASSTSGKRPEQDDDESRAHRCTAAAPPWLL